jgi:hypothetical protein
LAKTLKIRLFSKAVINLRGSLLLGLKTPGKVSLEAPYGMANIMRVHTSQSIVTLGSYLKLGLSLVVLYVLVSQAFKYWQQEPSVQQLQQLIETETAQPQE